MNKLKAESPDFLFVALRYPLYTRDPNDFFTKPGDAYHFYRVRVWETELTFETVGLDEDTGKWVVADTFTIFK